MPERRDDTAAGAPPRRLRYFSAGFLRERRIRRILGLAGHDLRLGRPAPEDLIAVWGRSPRAARGEAMAARSGAGLLRVEDAFLRSLRPGRAGDPPIGLVADRGGAHFEGDAATELETLLATAPFDDTALLDRARGGIARMREAHLTKYTGFDPEAPVPDPGYVLVIDQTEGDASVRFGGADRNTFREMLYWAQEDFPAGRIVIEHGAAWMRSRSDDGTTTIQLYGIVPESDSIGILAPPQSWQLLAYPWPVAVTLNSLAWTGAADGDQIKIWDAAAADWETYDRSAVYCRGTLPIPSSNWQPPSSTTTAAPYLPR